MSENVQLKHLFIGDIDGEIESARNNFEQLFYKKNSEYNQITETEKFIISGRKGTGKTILSKYINKKLSKENGYACKIFNRHDFKLQQLIDLEYRTLANDELTLFWKWTFLVQMGASLLDLDTTRKFIPYTKENKLKRFYKKKYPEDVFKLKDFNTSNTKNRKLNSQYKQINKSVAASAEDTRQINSNFIKTEYFESLKSLEKLVFNCINNTTKKIVLIYDDLDELEDKTSENSSYYRVLLSMLETIKEINLSLSNEGKTKSKIIILLRSDIIDDLHKHSSNSNKLITGSKVDLNWIPKKINNPQEHPIIEMVLNKIKISIPEYHSLTNIELYKILFPKKINNKEIIDHLINYSYGRPRDIVRYLTLVIENNPNAKYFDPKFFQECSQAYSKWFFNELENEISISTNKDMLFDGLKLINDFKKNIFDFKTIEKYHIENNQSYPNIVDLKETIKVLYKYGVIGNSWVHKKYGNKTTYRYSWGYRDDANNEPSYSNTFVIHYGLRKYFSL